MIAAIVLGVAGLVCACFAFGMLYLVVKKDVDNPFIFMLIFLLGMISIGCITECVKRCDAYDKAMMEQNKKEQ